MLSLGAAEVHASKCKQAGDDHYALGFLGGVQDDREFVRSHYCPLTWDAKKGVWYGPASAVKTCLRQAPIVKDGKPTRLSVDSDPDPRAAQFVFSVVNSTDTVAWRDFGKLVHVNLPSPSKAVGPALGPLGGLLLMLGRNPTADAVAAETLEASRQLGILRAIDAANTVVGGKTAPQVAPARWHRTYRRIVGPLRDFKLAEEAGIKATRVAGRLGTIEALAAALWPVAVSELVAWSIGYAVDHTCTAMWFDERKALLDTYFKEGGAITYSFRLNTGGLAADNYVEQTILAHLKGADAPIPFPLMQDRRPFEFR
jgi:hypothetical protein